MSHLQAVCLGMFRNGFDTCDMAAVLTAAWRCQITEAQCMAALIAARKTEVRP